MIDFLFIIIVALCAILGFRKGLLKSILGPGSLILFTVISILIYKIQGNLILAIIVGLIGPFAFHICLIILLQIMGILGDKDKKPSFKSRVSGAVFSGIWTALILLLTIITAVFLPVSSGGFKSFQEKILKSQTYKISNALCAGKLPTSLATQFDPNDPKQVEKLQNSQEFKNLQENEAVKDLMLDPEVQQLIEERNITALLGHPKMKKILEDPELIEEFISLHKAL